MRAPRWLCNILSMSALFVVLIPIQAPHADGKVEACKRLADEIRVRVDRILSGDPMPRLVVALEAHERLNCPVDDLLTALGLPASGVDVENK